MKNFKMDKMWRIIFAIAITGLVFYVLTFNRGNSHKLSEVFNQETLIEEAKRAVGYFNDADYQNVIDMGNGILDEVITVEKFEELCSERMAECGAFVEFTETEVAGTRGQDSGAEYGVVMLNAAYENGSQKFFLAFDTDMNLVQFQIQ